MKDLYQSKYLDEILLRINKLSPDSQRLWGKMNVNQMLTHCTLSMEAAVGDKLYPQLLIGKLIGRFMKYTISNEKSFSKNSPTNPSFVVKDTKEFHKERERLIEIIKRFSTGGEEKCTRNPHSFFGNLTPHEWGILMYKHIDHHLKQFNV
jgi:Protein of unknown function (DUF1569)